MRRRKSWGCTLASSAGSNGRWNQWSHSPPRLWLEALEDRRVLANPSISDIPDQVTNEDTATAAINFTIGGDGTLTLAGGSSNATLVPNSNIVFGGSGANRTVTVTPAANQFGSSTITVTVDNGGGSPASDTFLLTVNAVNDAPVSVVDRYFVLEDHALTAMLAPAPTTLFPTNGVWKYLDQGTNEGTAWQKSSFNDSAWLSGPAQLGYGDGDEATVVGFGPNANNKYVTTYFRTSFNVVDALHMSAMQIKLHRDDGVAVYLNGVEVVRDNLAAAAAFNTFAASVAGDDGGALLTFNVPANLLIEGTNVLAAEVHQANATSSDISFDLELSATHNVPNVLANDTDVEMNPLTAVLVRAPSHGTFTWATNGTFTYTPNANFHGDDNFAYKANDGAADSNVVTAPIRVVAVNDAQSTIANSYNTNQGSTLNVSNTGDVPVELLPAGAVWAYLDNGSNQGTGWRDTAFNDSTWVRGPAQLGYGDGDEVTTVGFGPDAANKYVTTYFRTTFDLRDPASITSLALHLVRDDGAAVYLNGTEVARTSNLAPNAAFDTLADFNGSAAVGGADESTFFDFTGINPSLLVEGTNELAVEIHQHDRASSDISFDMQVTATRRRNGVLANDSDLDGDALTATIVAPAGNGNAVMNADGTFSYTPGNGFFGTDTFTYAPHEKTQLVATGSVWNYLDDGSNQGIAWRQTAFNDSSWALGPAQLGYGETDESTVVSFGPDANNKRVTTYFRNVFSVTDPTKFQDLTLRFLRDDGAAVYLNGSEVARTNLNAGAAFNEFANAQAADDGQTYQVFTVDPALLTEGINVLAVEMHQVNGTSSDISFDLELKGTVLSAPTLVTINVAAVGLNVVNTDESGNGSLRQAIINANADPGHPHTINFMIPGAAPHVIQLNLANLPPIADPVSLNIIAGDVIEVGTTASSFTFGEYADLSKIGAGTLTISGSQSHNSAAMIHAAGGVLNLNSDGGNQLTIEATATVRFGSTQQIAALHVGAGGTATLTAGGGKVLVVSDLVVNGTLDLADNDLVVQATSETRAALLDHVVAKLTSGFAAGGWNGPGIDSSAAASDAGHLTALGVMLNEFFEGFPYYFEFSGIAVDNNSILVKYTFYGDTDLTGVVDGSDYSGIDNGFNFSLSGWINGDFNYSNSIDGTDYAFIDNAFNFQSGTLSAGAPQAAQLMDLSGGQPASAPAAATDSSRASGDSVAEARLAPNGALLPLDASTAQAIALAIHSSSTRDTLDDDLLDLLSGRAD